MSNDLLTFKSDREKDYYVADGMFKRRFNIFQTWLNDTPALTPELLDGLSGRSCVAVNGARHTIYFVKQLIVDFDGKFAKTLVRVGKVKDVIIDCQPSLFQVTDIVCSLGQARFRCR